MCPRQCSSQTVNCISRCLDLQSSVSLCTRNLTNISKNEFHLNCIPFSRGIQMQDHLSLSKADKYFIMIVLQCTTNHLWLRLTCSREFVLWKTRNLLHIADKASVLVCIVVGLSLCNHFCWDVCSASLCYFWFQLQTTDCKHRHSPISVWEHYCSYTDIAISSTLPAIKKK